MDAVLISITGLSLILAIAMGVVLFTVLREQRKQADARVAMLVVAAGAAGAVEPAAAESGAEPAALLALNDAQMHDDLFVARNEPSPWARRLAVAAALAACVAVAGYVVLPRASGSIAAAPAGTINPLELLTLGHTQEPDALTVTGLVHNPRNGAALKQVTATAFLFGDGGTFLASGRANLDFTTLAPGDDSPFVIKIPVTGVVTRYRVGFRGADGAVIAHVDRRGDGSSARHAAPSGSTPWAQ
jgi:hypothetical protein